ncbi:MAG: hypothetical protein O7D86_10100 [Proteobacteria bacterium]|nr:hypothetical protein [Pseudomonadota bacterium]
MYILGLNSGHDASAALMQDDTLIAYCKEERITRKKQAAGKLLRQKATEVILKIADIISQKQSNKRASFFACEEFPALKN